MTDGDNASLQVRIRGERERARSIRKVGRKMGTDDTNG